MQASENIMKAHQNANIIPVPYTSSTAALKVLRDHYEILEHTERFISLSTDKNAANEITTVENLKKLLNLLPQRVRMSDPDLGVAETDPGKRFKQYIAIKKWITDNQQLLVCQGTKLEDKAETQVALITNIDKQSEGQKRNNKNNAQFNSNFNKRRQTGWNDRQQQQGNNQQNQDQFTGQPVTSCGLCSLIKESEVSQEYVNQDFNDIHWRVTDRGIYANQCLPFYHG